MKKFVSLILMLALIMSFSACAQADITMQEIYDANLTEALLQNHQSLYIRSEIDGVVWNERYLTEEYVYDYIPDEESDWAQFMTDDVCYCYMGGSYLRYLPITPDGVSDFASYRAEHYASQILSEDSMYETIESVSQTDDRITVKSILGQEGLVPLGLASNKLEYVLDADTREVISCIGDYTYEDGSTFGSVAEVAYDAEAPEMVNAFLEYENQTENLRNITVVSNPGTEKEVSTTVQVPKGLIVGFRYNEDSAYEFNLYTDAACTELYDPYVDTDSDLSIYVKWTE